jgi:hypothetical protein
MKWLVSSVLLLLLVLPMAASAGEIDLRIKGVGLGTPQSIILRRLGKPLQIKKGKFDPCGGDVTVTRRYSGLVIELLGDGNERNFTVVSIELTSSKWSVARGIRVGAEAKDVIKKFGEPLEKVMKSGLERWSYVNKGNDGFAGFYFRNNKLVKVEWESALC